MSQIIDRAGVLEIVRLLKSTAMDDHQIAAQVDGATSYIVSSVRRGKRWVGVTGGPVQTPRRPDEMSRGGVSASGRVDIAGIQAAIDSGEIGRAVAERFGVSQTTVSQIKHGQYPGCEPATEDDEAEETREEWIAGLRASLAVMYRRRRPGKNAQRGLLMRIGESLTPRRVCAEVGIDPDDWRDHTRADREWRSMTSDQLLRACEIGWSLLDQGGCEAIEPETIEGVAMSRSHGGYGVPSTGATARRTGC